MDGHPFTPALFKFLAELKENNTREWFQANKARFETDVRGPLLAFIEAFGAPLESLNPHFLADPRPAGGSMFRLHRDTRFARDKSPYKTNVGAQFRHQSCGKDVHSPGFYLHLEPGGCFASAGLWRPDPPTLKRVRDYLVEHPRAWKTVLDAGLEVEGETLARVPQGFDPAHPLAAVLRLKEYHASAALTQREVCSADFLSRYTDFCRSRLPLVKLLAKAMDLPW